MRHVSPPRYVLQILTSLQARGHLAYLVGGCVRDILMDAEPHDWDICTSALPEEVMAVFPDSRPTGLKHGTVTVIIGRHSAEVTTFRTEGDYRDHRRPETVTFVTDLISDLGRRDFTMNAIALSADGLLSDPYGGVQDIENRCIRCVGQPERRFTEDALRMLRALRFSARLGFDIEPETLEAIRKCAPLAADLSAERVREEVEKLLLSPRPEVLGFALECGLLNRYVNAREIPDLSFIPALPPKALPRWAALCFALKKGAAVSSAGEFLTALRLDSRTIRCCQSCEEMLTGAMPESGFEWKKLLNKYGVDAVSCAAEVSDSLNRTECAAGLKTVLKSGECFSVKRLAVTGDDLLELGYKGHELGDMLRFLLDYVMEHPERNTREILISLAGHTEES